MLKFGSFLLSTKVKATYPGSENQICMSWILGFGLDEQRKGREEKKKVGKRDGISRFSFDRDGLKDFKIKGARV